MKNNNRNRNISETVELKKKYPQCHLGLSFFTGVDRVPSDELIPSVLVLISPGSLVLVLLHDTEKLTQNSQVLS